jgi:hypothetical protein
MPSISIRPHALVVIDMQRDFIEPGGFGDALGNDVSRLQAIVPTVAALIGAVPPHGLPVDPHARGAPPDLSDCPPSQAPARQCRACGSAMRARWAAS